MAAPGLANSFSSHHPHLGLLFIHSRCWEVEWGIQSLPSRLLSALQGLGTLKLYIEVGLQDPFSPTPRDRRRVTDPERGSRLPQGHTAPFRQSRS